VEAKLKPRDIETLSGRVIESCLKDELFIFKYAFTLENDSIFYEPFDINFPSSTPIDLRDLDIN
jgi:hypothetical protein